MVAIHTVLLAVPRGDAVSAPGLHVIARKVARLVKDISSNSRNIS
ncbi:unnamed protein product [Acidocella sp. C78]|nr:unnamed protein product [Acidocella sp. C78]